MSASKALEHIRRHGSPRDVQMALYYVTRGRTAPLLELARSVTPTATPAPDGPPSADRPAVPTPAAASVAPPPAVELPV